MKSGRYWLCSLTLGAGLGPRAMKFNYESFFTWVLSSNLCTCMLNICSLNSCDWLKRVLRPHTLRDELGTVITRSIPPPSHGHCVVLLTIWHFRQLLPTCRLWADRAVVSACVALFSGSVWSCRGYCALISGALSQSDVCALVYVTGQFVRTRTVFKGRDRLFPTVVHLWPSAPLLQHQTEECVFRKTYSIIYTFWWNTACTCLVGRVSDLCWSLQTITFEAKCC